MTARSHGAPRVVIVGGGISGLSAAYRLHELAARRGSPVEVQVLERGSRPGGPIWTEASDGMLLEGGPDQFVTHKPAGRELCRRLDLADRLIEIDGEPPRVLHHDRPHPLPEGFRMMAPTRLGPLWRSPLFTWRGKLRIACEPLLPRGGSASDESLRSFVVRRFGNELYERVAEPIVGGIFTARGEALSMEMCMPALLEMERRHGSVTRGLRRKADPAARRGAVFLSLRDGMGSLVDALVRSLPENTLRTGACVERAGLDGESSRWRITLNDGTAVEADVLVLACPSHASAAMLRDHDRRLADDLGRLDYASCATVGLAYPRDAARRPLEGHGFFIPTARGLPLLACSYVSSKFPYRVPQDRILLRAFVGGANHPAAIEQSDARIADLAHRTLTPMLGLRGEPLSARVFRFPSSLPQLDVGFQARRSRMLERAATHPGLVLGGGAVGAFGIPGCVASGESAAERALELAGRAAGPQLAASRG